MPRSRQSRAVDDTVDRSRGSITFEETLAYKRTVEGFDETVEASIKAKVDAYAEAYRKSISDADIPAAFKPKGRALLDRVPGQYMLREIHTGYDYRVAIMFPDRGTHAYLIHAWKKTGDQNKEAIDRAKKRARRFWSDLQEQGGDV